MTPMSSPLDGNGVAAAVEAFRSVEAADMAEVITLTQRGIEAAIAAYLATIPPAPSHTAVEPVAELVERLRPKHTADEPIARAVVSNDQKERRDAVSAYLVQNNALKSDAASALTAQAAALAKAEGCVEALMAERTSLIATKREQLAAAESEVATLKARVAELEAAGKRIEPYLAFTIGPESPGYHPTMPSAVASFRDTLARRLTHQEKNNG